MSGNAKEGGACTACGRKFTKVARPLVVEQGNLFGQEDRLCLKCQKKQERKSKELFDTVTRPVLATLKKPHEGGKEEHHG